MRLLPSLPAVVTTLLCGLLFSPVALPASAGTDAGRDFVRLSEVRSGTLLLKVEDAAGQPAHRELPSLSSDVRIQVTGPIARTVLVQRFVNPTDTWAEALYAFPLPETAAVDHLRMRIGERVIVGEIQEKAQARRTYEIARAAGQRSALVEQARPNLFSTAVANIPPQGEIHIEIEYQQELQWRDGAFSLRFPMAVTPRYAPQGSAPIVGSSQAGDGWALLPGELHNAADITPHDEAGASAPHNPVTLSVQLQPGFALGEVSSAGHAIASATRGDVTTVTLRDGSVPSDRDFVLRWAPAAASQVQSALFTQETDSGRYGLLMLMPPQQEFTPGRDRGREVIFIVDTSGSMSGESIRAARAGLEAGLDRLGPGDRFNLIQFNSDTEVLFAEPVEASPQQIERARRWTQGLTARGGTEMAPALRLGLSQPRGESAGRLRQVVFITDGAVSNEAELLSLIHRQLGDARLFTVGIGSAPNAHFMTEAAQFGRGSFSYIADSREVETGMRELFMRLDRPALTDLRLDLAQGRDSLPDPLPDLYFGEPVSVVMRLDAAPLAATLSGRLGTRPWQHQLQLSAGAPQSGIDVLWARRKITHWMREGRRGLDAGTVRQNILELALRHHLVSEYTSLVAVDKTPVRPQDAALDRHALKSNLPAGMSPPSTQMAQGSTPSLWLTLIGALLALAGLLLARAPQAHAGARCA